jgi:tetratricopeptide (TPR) repeat protein
MDVLPDRAPARAALPAWFDPASADRLSGCELHASVDGFRSNILNLEGSKNLGQLDVGTVILYPLTRMSGTLVSATSLQAPRKARKAREQAARSLKKRDFEKAEKELDKAVQIYPRYAEAWFALGQLHQLGRRIQDARNAYQKAVAADGNYVKPYVGLARLAGIDRHWKEMAEITDHAVALDPIDFPEAYYLNAVAYYRLKQFDAAEKSARKVLRLDPLHELPAAHLILADILEQRRDFAGSIEQLKTYLQISPNAPSAEQVRARIKGLEGSPRKGA